MYKHVLFDLDGTLTDSKEGIVKSIQYGLKKIGIDEQNEKLLESFVGPPLMTTFLHSYDLPEEKAQAAYKGFQERYAAVGIFENKVYPGIFELLKCLQETQIFTYIATSKPAVHAKRIAAHFGLDAYLTRIEGSSLGGTEEKAVIIGQVLQSIGVYDEGTVVMVGDRKFDLIGAAKSGLPAIGVTYGYGSQEELLSYHPACMADSAEALLTALIKK